MTQPEIEASLSDVLFHTIFGFTFPFFIVGACGDMGLCRAAIFELIEAYNAASVRELNLIGRIICFETAAMDNLRLSMQPGLSDAKVLRYRSNAVNLSRSSDRCQTMLDAIQAAPRTNTDLLAAPIAAPAPAPVETVAAEPLAAQAVSSKRLVAQQTKAQAPKVTEPGWMDANLEEIQHEARMLIEALHADGGELSAFAHPSLVDPIATYKAAARAALAAAGVQRDPATG